MHDGCESLALTAHHVMFSTKKKREKIWLATQMCQLGVQIDNYTSPNHSLTDEKLLYTPESIGMRYWLKCIIPGAIVLEH